MKDLFVSRNMKYESIVVWIRNILEFSAKIWNRVPEMFKKIHFWKFCVQKNMKIENP